MNWKDLVKQVAPVLGTALGGPFGGMAAKWLSGSLLGDENAGEEALEQAVLSGNPDTLLKIKELDAKFKTDMARIGLDEEKLATQDRSSARDMAVKTTLLPQMIISTIFVIAFSTILYTVFTEAFDLTSSQQNVVMYLLGILSAGMVQVMNFWFGSSAGSKQKDNKLHL